MFRRLFIGDPNEWEWWDSVFPKPLIDGTRSGWLEKVLRRRVKGVWQYRLPTPAESRQRVIDWTP